MVSACELWLLLQSSLLVDLRVLSVNVLRSVQGLLPQAGACEKAFG